MKSIILLCFLTLVICNTKLYIGNNTIWNDPLNWHPNGIPINGDNVIITNKNVTYSQSPYNKFESIHLDNSTLTIHGRIIINTSFTSTNFATIVLGNNNGFIQGFLTYNGPNVVVIENVYVYNTGAITSNDNNNIYLIGDIHIYGDFTIFIGNNLGGYITNYGCIHIYDSILWIAGASNMVALLNDGTIKMYNNAIITANIFVMKNILSSIHFNINDNNKVPTVMTNQNVFIDAGLIYVNSVHPIIAVLFGNTKNPSMNHYTYDIICNKNYTILNTGKRYMALNIY